MQNDDVIWKIIGDGFCSYKIKVDRTLLCRNEFNLNGICKSAFCPLSNSRYATVREHEDKCYLYIKVIERSHSPKKLWQKVELSKDYNKALEQIDQLLVYWPTYMIHKCKQRLTRLVQYLIRKRRLQSKSIKKIVHINKKVERREARREIKALSAAKIEKNIEKELLLRLQEGMYDDIYNLNERVFDKITGVTSKKLDKENQVVDMDDENVVEKEDDEQTNLDDNEEQELTIEFVPDSEIEESDDDIEEQATSIPKNVRRNIQKLKKKKKIKLQN